MGSARLYSQVISETLLWRSSQQDSTAANDSDVTFTVSTGVEWQITDINVDFTAAAVAGSRRLEVDFQDNSTASNVISRHVAGVSQAATTGSGSTRYYNFYVGAPYDRNFIDSDKASIPIPENLHLTSGYSIRVFDNKAIATTQDDMIIRMNLIERVIPSTFTNP